MPFDELQPIEYGWCPALDTEDGGSGLAITRSNIAFLATEVLRGDYHPKWRRETARLLASAGRRKRFSLGSPMDYARIEMVEWAKMLREYSVLMRLRHVHGVARPATLFDPLLDRNREEKIWTAENYKSSWFWRPKTDYSTVVFRISENLVPSTDMRPIMIQLEEKTGSADFERAPKELQEDILKVIEELSRKKGVYSVQMFMWLPWSLEEEQAEALEYQEECERYQASQAGRKAKRLLLENLTSAQEESYFKKGYFFVVPPSDEPLEKRHIYAIERSYPNGNILQVRRKKVRNKRTGECGEFWFPIKDFCFHTEEPHAIDDIILSQKLMIEHDEQNFIKESNITLPRGGGKLPLDHIKRSV